MNNWSFHDGIDLHVQDRISSTDSTRQRETARAILQRLNSQPGLILADEVGMGKTFVALAVAAVAASVTLSDRKRSVVVMIPPSLKEKWPRDFEVFKEKCVPPALGERLRCASAETGVQFLKLLDNSLRDSLSVIFLTHGAMSRTLTDGWVRLAIIRQALLLQGDQRLRSAVADCAASLVEVSSKVKKHPDLCSELLDSPPETWRNVMRKHGYELEEGDNPIPTSVVEALRTFDTRAIYQALEEHVPRNKTSSYDDRLHKARAVLRDELKSLWSNCIRGLDFTLPLLILDEAHHLKNKDTQLAGLFSSESAADAEEVSKGPLAEVFERMLFLTATPFQLGHHELCCVLERFNGIAWASNDRPSMDRDGFEKQIEALRESLDSSQKAAEALDNNWGKLRPENLIVEGEIATAEIWWNYISTTLSRSHQAEQVYVSYNRTYEKMRAAEKLLAPWVIRHLRNRYWDGIPRRVRRVGGAIQDDFPDDNTAEASNLDECSPGLGIGNSAILPFLLAARASFCNLDSRPLFAEGLASSYEAFRHTRKEKHTVDADAKTPEEIAIDNAGDWYLNQLDQIIPLADPEVSAAHPKIVATVNQALRAWSKGEKVLVFCHFIKTGHTLRKAISHKMRQVIMVQAAKRMVCDLDEAKIKLEKLGERFFDRESPARKASDSFTKILLSKHPSIASSTELIQDVVRRFLRTPSFLIRYFSLGSDFSLSEMSVLEAFEKMDTSGISLKIMLEHFFEYLERCTARERESLLQAIDGMQTGDISTWSDDEHQGESIEGLMANIRLVNGGTKPETRQRLMQTFNSPFFPEVLITSNVMAEGVDLHRCCRYIIHHDLDWNPSTLEQRTGRVDRIGAKVEKCRRPIRVYLPFIAETQDEKMFRVVMDRERWFSVVMGENFKLDLRNTEKIANRVPLPAMLASKLAFRLQVEGM